MKTIILSFLLILGLSTQNYSKPINNIYSIADPVYGAEVYNNCVSCNAYLITAASAPDSNDVQMNSGANLNANTFDTGVISDKGVTHMKMKTVEEVNISDPATKPEKVFYEKLSERLTEQYRTESGTGDVPAAYDNSFSSYEFNVPRSLSVLINSSGKQTARQ